MISLQLVALRNNYGTATPKNYKHILDTLAMGKEKKKKKVLRSIFEK